MNIFYFIGGCHFLQKICSEFVEVFDEVLALTSHILSLDKFHSLQ